MIWMLVAGGALALFYPWASVAAIALALLTSAGSASLPELTTLTVGFASLLFATDYLKRSKGRFMSVMTFFLGAMMLFLRAGDWLYLYFSWELMSICSYVLIALRSTEAARKAARKALVLNRISGLAFLLAIIVINATTGSFALGAIPPAAAVLLLVAAMVKSSQVPFLWLPDAMEAPTPVSALLHSATMVVAGPLLINRFYEHFNFLAPFIHDWALVSLVAASFLALVQTNQKRLLAYSTIASVAFLYMIAGTPLLPVAFAMHALLKAAFFILVGTYAAEAGYMMETGFNRRSLSSGIALFLAASLSGAPLLGFFWLKVGEGAAAVTVFLSVMYFAKMYSTSFSGGVTPKRGIGTYIALVMAGLSVLLYPWSVPPLQETLVIAAAAAAAVAVFRVRALHMVGGMLEWLFSLKLPEVEPPEEQIESWGYSVGKAVHHMSSWVKAAFTGPVSRDIKYIAAALAAIALGMITR